MTREEARKILTHNWTRIDNPNYSDSEMDEAFFMAIEALSTEATKKKAELKENGDWDCPVVYCDECDHHRRVEWCSLAIPSHEEIDDTYKMVNEAFFKGFDAAEEQYRLLIEEVEELEKKSADAVQGEWVRKYDDKVNCYWYECDQCGEYRPRNQFGHEYNANFCPNCGAKMDGERK